jgi:NADPH-dependent curcumin reductase CurA
MRAKAIIARRSPDGVPSADDFSVEDFVVAPLQPGEVLYETLLLSIDPHVRRRLPQAAWLPKPHGDVTAIGEVVVAGTRPPPSPRDAAVVGRVLESRSADFRPGDFVFGGFRWQTLHVDQAAHLHHIQPTPATALVDELGLLGQPGFVAWYGVGLADLQPGEVFVVSSGGGAVGMVAGQLAKRRGARVIGIASGSKVGYVVDELGFDACIDRTREDVTGALDALAPEGVDVYFDNVGGTVTDAVMTRMADFGRVIVCGMASEYNRAEPVTGPPLRPVLRKRLRIQGFVIYDHGHLYPRFRELALRLVADGGLKYRNHIFDGFERAPEALGCLLRGENEGRVVVRVSDEVG